MKWPHGAFGNRDLALAQKRAVRTLGHQQGPSHPREMDTTDPPVCLIIDFTIGFPGISESSV